MDISVEKVSELGRSLKVSLPEEALESEVTKRIVDLQKTVRLDGFRKVKIPLKIVQQRFGKQVRSEVMGELVQSSFGEAVEKEALRPAGQPVVDVVTGEQGAGLSYTAKFEVFPEISLQSMDQVKISKKTCDVTPKDIDGVIEKLRLQHQDWTEKKEKASEGDKLHVAFKGLIDDSQFEGGTGEDENLVLGSNSMIDGFEKGLIGCVAGVNLVLDLQFPSEYRKQELAGKKVKFEIEVKAVFKPKIPEIDAEFMKKFGVENGDNDKFEADIRQRLEAECQLAIERDLNRDVVNGLLELNKFEVPETLISGEVERSREQVMRSWFMQGKNPKEAEQEFEEELQVEAVKRVKSGLIMAEIVKEGDLKADPEKVRQAIERIAAGYEDSTAVSKWYYENQQQMQAIESQCLEEEVLKWVADRAQVSQKSVSFDDIMDPMQTT